jgi:hypothetical protein
MKQSLEISKQHPLWGYDQSRITLWEAVKKTSNAWLAKVDCIGCPNGHFTSPKWRM